MQPLTENQVQQLIGAVTRGIEPDSDGRATFIVTNVQMALREIFSAGEKQGRAKMLAAAAELMTPSVTDKVTEQRSNSARIIAEWVDAQPAKNMYCQSDNYYHVGKTARGAPDEKWVARVWLQDPVSGAQRFARAFYGASHDECLSKLATWCQSELDQTPPERAVSGLA